MQWLDSMGRIPFEIETVHDHAVLFPRRSETMLYEGKGREVRVQKPIEVYNRQQAVF